MVPDPVCASCRGSFVEMMENPTDNPRDFAHTADPEVGPANLDPLYENILIALLGARSPNIRSTGSRLFVPFPGGSAGSSLGGPSPIPSPLGNAPIPTMSEFLRRGPELPDGITPPLMLQTLLSMLGGSRHDPSTQLGRMNLGDYAFNQEALDQIITQIMENSNGTRPVPATEEIIDRLPREVLEVGSPILESDCAVCKEQFQLETEDVDEQVVITLPCQHPFHMPCILPWLTSSGTCPVCRHALVPQPSHHPPGPESNTQQDNRSARPTHSRTALPGRTLGSFFGANAASSSDNRHNRSNSDPPFRSARDFPGGWNDSLD